MSLPSEGLYRERGKVKPIVDFLLDRVWENVVYSIYMISEDAVLFEWDKGNIGKNKKHTVEDEEAEEVFFDKNKKTFIDRVHSGQEERLRVVGKTRNNRLLFVVFTMRGKDIRVISARDVNKKEVYLYEKIT